MTTLPTELGYRMPAEWERHEATWIAWPHETSDWPGKFAPIPWVYTEIVRHLQPDESVRILVNDQRSQKKAERALNRSAATLDNVRFFRIPTDRCWVRDFGPIFLTLGHRETALTQWGFNAWSNYSNWRRDRDVPRRIGKSLKLPTFAVRRGDGKSPVVLEGGSIDVNGRGCLLTTEECLLSDVQQRNPGLARADYERLFLDYLGVAKVVWLGKGIAGDDTHGHVDDLARFVGPSTVVAGVEEKHTDENYGPLLDNLDRLRGATDQAGKRLEVVPLPMPRPLYFDGRRLPASYLNFYIANSVVLVPTFNDSKDRLALGILAELFLEKEVVGIHAVDLVWGLGTLHCLTQQQPAIETTP
jgi:agmatine deiminase